MTGAMIGSTRSWLRAKSVLVPDDWLEACVEWIKEENQGNTITQSQINDLVYEQWLLADLHELKTQCLPNGLADAAKHQLSGSFALQVDSIIDAGHSYYSQLQKLKGTTNANVGVSAETTDQKPWEPKPSRMLMLDLTDGTNNIKGMEHKPLTCLSPDFQPGTKVLVHGAVLCRRGVLFLTNNNLKVFGGEVDALIEQNTKENILTQALESSMQHVGIRHRKEFHGNDIKPSQSNVKKNIAAQRGREMTGTINRNQPFSGGNTRPGTNTKAVKEELDAWDEDEIPIDELDEMVLEQTGNVDNTSNVKPITTGSTNTSERTRDKPSAMGNIKSTMSTPNHGNRNSYGSNTVQTCYGTNTAGVLKQEICQSSINENVPLKNLVSHSRSKMSSLKEDCPNPKRQKLNDNASVYCDLNQNMSTPRLSSSNLDSVFNDDFEDDLNLFGEEMSTSVTADVKNSKSTPATEVSVKKPDVEKPAQVSSGGVNAGEKVRKLLPPAEQSFENQTNFSESDTSYKACSKKPLFSTTGNCKESNTSIKLEPTSPSTTSKSVSNSGLGTLDRFLSPAHQSAAPMTQAHGETNKKKDGQMKLTDYTLLKTANVGIDAEPFTYLSIVKKQLTSLDTATYKVKAYISTLIGRLDSFGGKEWKLACKINDGSDSLDVDLSNGVLTGLIGFSAPDSLVMKKRAKHDPSVKEILVEGIQQCQQKLIELLCIMEIRASPNQGRPEVIALHQMTPEKISALERRVKLTLDNQ